MDGIFSGCAEVRIAPRRVVFIPEWAQHVNYSKTGDMAFYPENAVSFTLPELKAIVAEMEKMNANHSTEE
jgi:hypothetical protein